MWYYRLHKLSVSGKRHNSYLLVGCLGFCLDGTSGLSACTLFWAESKNVTNPKVKNRHVNFLHFYLIFKINETKSDTKVQRWHVDVIVIKLEFVMFGPNQHLTRFSALCLSDVLFQCTVNYCYSNLKLFRGRGPVQITIVKEHQRITNDKTHLNCILRDFSFISQTSDLK